jgi:homoserine kinase
MPKTGDDSKTEIEIERTLAVCIPASTSNLGPGFDTLGLAVSIYNRVRFDLLAHDNSAVPLITLTGETETDCARLPQDKTNHIYKVLSEYVPEELLSRVRIKIDCAIPVGSGLGSSGTATLAALWAARMLSNAPPNREFLLQEATRFEGHPDNVAPSLFGGFKISALVGTAKRVVVQQLPWPDEWMLLFVVPARELKTSRARAVLPKTVPFSDAVHNVQRVSLLLAAIAGRDQDMLAYAFEDRLHQPYRAELVPELDCLRRIIKGTGALGCALSGAGPSVMIVAHRRNIEHVAETVNSWAHKQAGSPPRVLPLCVDQVGLKQLDG